MPLRWDLVQDQALKVNKKTREELALAPHPEEVWHRFAKWCAQWNLKGRSDGFSAPIAAGHNIYGFDLAIYDRYCKMYKTTRVDKFSGELRGTIFNSFFAYDTMQMLNSWWEGQAEPNKVSLDFLRRYFSMPIGDRATHDALQDVRDTAAILCRLLAMQRTQSAKIVWKDCFDPEKREAEVLRRKELGARDKARKEKAKSAKSYR